MVTYFSLTLYSFSSFFLNFFYSANTKYINGKQSKCKIKNYRQTIEARAKENQQRDQDSIIG